MLTVVSKGMLAITVVVYDWFNCVSFGFFITNLGDCVKMSKITAFWRCVHSEYVHVVLTASAAARVARSPVFYWRSRISDPFSRLPGGSRREEQISRILLVRLSRHSEDTVIRKYFVSNYYYMAHL